jgi:hypothetical protein
LCNDQPLLLLLQDVIVVNAAFMLLFCLNAQRPRARAEGLIF